MPLQFKPGKPVVMGILNITPDSFSDGGRLYRGDTVNIDQVLRSADTMVSDGAGILDIGGESTRPGAEPVPVAQELERVIPVIEALQQRFDLPLSVDTSSPAVMLAAAAAGASLINDVRALGREGALQAAAESGLPVCLMHMQGEPGSMQQQPSYHSVVEEVRGFLQQRVARCVSAGISKHNLLLDPGFGFGKTLEHNIALFRELPRLVADGLPVLVGVSRKRMVGNILAKNGIDRGVAGRVQGSAALALLAAQRGAAAVRVHDVKETVDVLRTLDAIESSNTDNNGES